MRLGDIWSPDYSGCHRQGIMGNCGFGCPVFLDGECHEPPPLEGVIACGELCSDEIKDLIDMYPHYAEHKIFIWEI